MFVLMFREQVKQKLAKVLSEFKPDIMIYNAGTDCMIHDPLGGLRVTPAGIVTRDEIVFGFAFTSKPFLYMCMFGLYVCGMCMYVLVYVQII